MEVPINALDDEDAIDDLDNGQRSWADKRCLTCLKVNRKRLIECAKCGGNYHRTCVGITGRQAIAIAVYTCPSCRDVITPNRAPPEEANQSNADFDILHHLKTCKANLSLLGNIPRGARISAAEALNELINDVIRTNTSISWMRLLCFTFHGLQITKKEKAID